MKIEATTTSRKSPGTKSASAKGDFTSAILVDRTPKDVFDAVANVRAWWSEDIDGPTDQLGAVFEFHYKTVHRSTQKITEFVPGKRIVWRVTESALTFVSDVKEWDGTEIVFDIAKKGDQTELRFTHVGLVPAVECYGQCSGAWGFYVQDSIKALLTTGKGKPNRKGRGASE
jgi:hypothetical protein